MLARVQQILVRACHAPDPWRSLRDALGSATELSDPERGWLERIDEDGLRVTALIVRKLRFERVLANDDAMIARFDRDPQAFAREFERYCAHVRPTFAFPADEKRAFAEFLARDE